MLKERKSQSFHFSFAASYAKTIMLMLLSYVKQTIADLLQNKIDMSQLVITKALAKAGEPRRCQ